MKIAYLNKGRIKAKSSTDELLELAYLKDMRRCWNRKKEKFISLGITEKQYFTLIKEKLREKYGLFIV
ncbi:hypothetical protein H9X96_03145 [Pedobacter sp. N36a]|uniref:hypothetical protein n=1 Tax=Pedobacter sp. N36a TaxID=2767996 RepID=UPI001656992C|nr:hypothetical protein [Pedobacter sp. N36a]MBC8984766.1 hypothetical protein [Pedobacter sp. N36a]